MKASPVAYELIKEFEKLRLRSYKNGSGDRWTIGWGSTAGVTQSTVIDIDEAIRRLHDDVAVHERALSRLIKVDVSQNQFDALLSWIFNVGIQAASTSTLIRKLNARASNVSIQLLSWNKQTVDGKVVILRGLTRRRVTERRLYDTGELVIEP